jgi:hypothetical protein
MNSNKIGIEQVGLLSPTLYFVRKRPRRGQRLTRLWEAARSIMKQNRIDVRYASQPIALESLEFWWRDFRAESNARRWRLGSDTPWRHQPR